MGKKLLKFFWFHFFYSSGLIDFNASLFSTGLFSVDFFSDCLFSTGFDSTGLLSAGLFSAGLFSTDFDSACFKSSVFFSVVLISAGLFSDYLVSAGFFSEGLDWVSAWVCTNYYLSSFAFYSFWASYKLCIDVFTSFYDYVIFSTES